MLLFSPGLYCLYWLLFFKGNRKEFNFFLVVDRKYETKQTKPDCLGRLLARDANAVWSAFGSVNPPPWNRGGEYVWEKLVRYTFSLIGIYFSFLFYLPCLYTSCGKATDS